MRFPTGDRAGPVVVGGRNDRRPPWCRNATAVTYVVERREQGALVEWLPPRAWG
jgi:hypothetical protein